MTMVDFEARLSERPLALDRSALPALAATAAARAGDLTVEQATAVSQRDGGAPLTRRAGATVLIPVLGLITTDPLLAWLTGGTSPDAIASAVRSAVADDAVTRIVLVVDSPGGEVSLVPELAADIRRARGVKPVLSIVRTQMASAAFWIGAQASEVWATPSANVGSVGVYALHVDASQANAKAGIQPTYIASSPEKIEGNFDAPLGADAKAFLQSRVDDVAARFVSDLAAGRNMPAAKVRANFGAGRSFGATEAHDRGMVDRVGVLEELLSASAASGRSGRSAKASAGEEAALIAAIIADYPSPGRSARSTEQARIEAEHEAIRMALGRH